MGTLTSVSRALSAACARLTFGAPVEYVYDPLDYARVPHEAYLNRYGKRSRPVLFLGMNPGPFGMAQTGVPFGDVALVRDFLGISGKVTRPPREHPQRPIEGFDCARSEVSGTRFWGWVRDRFGAPDAFFEHAFVANYCPLVFMEAGGKNRTPDKLPVAERDALYAACDEALRATCDALGTRTVVGIGSFAADRARVACAGRAIAVGTILHPSPASPRANRGWAAQADADLAKLTGLESLNLAARPA